MCKETTAYMCRCWSEHSCWASLEIFPNVILETDMCHNKASETDGQAERHIPSTYCKEFCTESVAYFFSRNASTKNSNLQYEVQSQWPWPQVQRSSSLKILWMWSRILKLMLQVYLLERWRVPLAAASIFLSVFTVISTTNTVKLALQLWCLCFLVELCHII